MFLRQDGLKNTSQRQVHIRLSAAPTNAATSLAEWFVMTDEVRERERHGERQITPKGHI